MGSSEMINSANSNSPRIPPERAFSTEKSLSVKNQAQHNFLFMEKKKPCTESNVSEAV